MLNEMKTREINLVYINFLNIFLKRLNIQLEKRGTRAQSSYFSELFGISPERIIFGRDTLSFHPLFLLRSGLGKLRNWIKGYNIKRIMCVCVYE